MFKLFDFDGNIHWVTVTSFPFFHFTRSLHLSQGGHNCTECWNFRWCSSRQRKLTIANKYEVDACLLKYLRPGRSIMDMCFSSSIFHRSHCKLYFSVCNFKFVNYQWKTNAYYFYVLVSSWKYRSYNLYSG